ncbi:tannase/feruloyl esterase family alpha/beta hydrolase [Sphingomonas sp. Root710]|uniref:tannase/feruloyl esterase family alpha/beta hydrolase n=1 Tax=Sphingomonas sp. Root710 TaxID=1736594 RepID=UPI00138EF5D2|nr:tannase/feruloyl esterase family alpha/beta hydrolase [Sphingomonas sp. Root710]
MCLIALSLTTEAEARAPAQAAPSSSQCEALMAADLMAVPDAPTHVTSARLVAAAGGKPAYCEAEGMVAPQVGILMWLPAQSWNGKFLMAGCGGYCGMFTFMAMCQEPLKRGYACITTDMGHKGQELGGLEWAYNNPQAVTDFAYRATHVTALAGKAIIRQFYGKSAARSYFIGCSCGGRQALIEAERFPYDFDGIVVGAPAISYVDITLDFGMRAQALYENGKPLFDKQSIGILGNAVIAKCDMNDGVKDGQIGDPRLCKFDPKDIVCTADARSNCLSAKQATAAAAFYAEQKSASGVTLGQRAFPPGTETSTLGMADTPILKPTFYEDFYKYLAFVPNPGPAWRFEQFDPNADYKRMGMTRTLMDAGNPDLSRFKAAGGKLIFHHGWGDGGLSPFNSIDLYNKIERTMGGRAATQEFLRLFMVPDADHCSGGKGPWSIDFLTYIENWVERAEAPELLIGAHYADSAPLGTSFGNAKPQFTRPIFPYPMAARYSGAGDPNDAANFKAVPIED